MDVPDGEWIAAPDGSREDEDGVSGQTLLVGLAHPDDEVGAAGAIRAQLSRGDRVVVVWLTRGEMTEAFGPIPPSEVARRRTDQANEAARILGAEPRLLDMGDTRLAPTREAAVEVARVICDVRPTGLLTWGDGWTRGTRHPDHQAAGKIFRDAVNLARIAKAVAPLEPHRIDVPVFTMRDLHSNLPVAAVDVTDHHGAITELARFYLRNVGFGNAAWLEHRLRSAGQRWNVPYAEEFDAWETHANQVFDALLPAPPLENLLHPERDARGR